jgi:predicted nucleic acid-binding protein
VALTVFDADVLIGYLDRSDSLHDQAVERVREAVRGRGHLRVCVVTYAEILIGPIRAAGRRGVERVDRMLGDFDIQQVAVDAQLARAAAEVRGQTKLTLGDAFVVATAVSARRRGFEDVRVESFDERVRKAFSTS